MKSSVLCCRVCQCKRVSSNRCRRLNRRKDEGCFGRRGEFALSRGHHGTLSGGRCLVPMPVPELVLVCM